MRIDMRNMILVVLSMLIFSCGTDNSKYKISEIEVYQVKGKDIPVFEEYVGQIYGAKDIAIRARVEGVLIGIHFKEGSSVKKGKLLYTIDAQPYEADVAAKMSGVAEAKTRLAKALSDLNRIKPLAEQKAVSQSDLDGAVAQYEAAKSSVEAANAVLRASQIQLGYTKIFSPISGVIGRTKAKVGDFVGKDPNPVILNTVSDISSILVQFFITEDQYLSAHRFSLSENYKTRKNRPADNLQLILSDNSYYKHLGEFDFIDREVDPQTGAILVQASFPNPEKLLRPGQYAKIKIRVDLIENGIIIPQRCLSELQGTFRVDIVNGENKIEKRAVKVGVTVGNFRIVKSGLKVGDKIVYEGLQKVRPGMPINPVVVDVQQIMNENGNNNE
jgi:membrane fusion protein (multidrug efflux system)